MVALRRRENGTECLECGQLGRGHQPPHLEIWCVRHIWSVSNYEQGLSCRTLLCTRKCVLSKIWYRCWVSHWLIETVVVALRFCLAHSELFLFFCLSPSPPKCQAGGNFSSAFEGFQQGRFSNCADVNWNGRLAIPDSQYWAGVVYKLAYLLPNQGCFGFRKSFGQPCMIWAQASLCFTENCFT